MRRASSTRLAILMALVAILFGLSLRVTVGGVANAEISKPVPQAAALVAKYPGDPTDKEASWCKNITRLKLCNSAYRDLAAWAMGHAENCRAQATICVNGDEANAFQHCLWSASLTLYHGESTARGFLERHEANSNGDDDSKRDWINNNTGFQVAKDAAVDMYVNYPRPTKKKAVFNRCIDLVRHDQLTYNK